MIIENKRVVSRNDIDKTLVEDDKLGLFLSDTKLQLIKKLGFDKYRLLDYSPNGNVILLKSKEWLTIRNANKTKLTAIDINTNRELFTTEMFLAYRGIIDSTSSRFLLEYYNGLCSIDINNGDIIYRKDKIDKSLYNADLNFDLNRVFIPTEKKSILTFDFSTNELKEIKLEKTASSTWVKFNNSQTQLLVSDKKNSLHCFEVSSFQKPIWSIDFSKYKTDTRIWASPILTTSSNLGCIQSTRPEQNQIGFTSGSLYVFDINSGKVLDNFEYSDIKLKLITDSIFDEIILDDLSKLSLNTKAITKTSFTSLIQES